MKDNSKKEELDNTVLILNKVLEKHKDEKGIKDLYKRSEKLKEKRKISR